MEKEYANQDNFAEGEEEEEAQGSSQGCSANQTRLPNLTASQRLCLPESAGNSHNYFGTVSHGSSENGWHIRWDVFPSDQQIVKLKRQRLTVLEAKEEEKDYDHAVLVN